MKKYLIKVLKRLFVIWLIWSLALTGYEMIRLKIPMKLCLYEEDAVTVLSGDHKNLKPEELYLDFAGNVQITEKSDGTYMASCHLFGWIPLKTMEIQVVSREEVIPGGIPVGIYIQTDGVFVIGTGNIETTHGLIESPAKNIIKTGDYITGFQGEPVRNKQELVKKLNHCREQQITLEIRRNEETMELSINPIILQDGAHMGIWIRDDTQGIGTLTYVTEDQEFGALGHGISDTDSELLMEVSEGKLYSCEIMKIVKGQKGLPGKLSGKIIYSKEHLYGTVNANSSGGIYGKGNEHLMENVSGKQIPIALKHEVKEGSATIISSVSGRPEEYTVEIRKVYRNGEDVNKGMELVVTDERLLEITGGIVQGMSGSPIIQNGKLIGAVTHVLVNDPTRGYGIFIENMLDAAG